MSTDAGPGRPTALELIAYSIPAAVMNRMSSQVSPGSQTMPGTITQSTFFSPWSPAPQPPSALIMRGKQQITLSG